MNLVNDNGVKHTKKSEKLSMLRKLKSKKISKSQNLAKSGKKLLKMGIHLILVLKKPD